MNPHQFEPVKSVSPINQSYNMNRYVEALGAFEFVSKRVIDIAKMSTADRKTENVVVVKSHDMTIDPRGSMADDQLFELFVGEFIANNETHFSIDIHLNGNHFHNADELLAKKIYEHGFMVYDRITPKKMHSAHKFGVNVEKALDFHITLLYNGEVKGDIDIRVLPFRYWRFKGDNKKKQLQQPLRRVVGFNIKP